MGFWQGIGFHFVALTGFWHFCKKYFSFSNTEFTGYKELHRDFITLNKPWKNGLFCIFRYLYLENIDVKERLKVTLSDKYIIYSAKTENKIR